MFTNAVIMFGILAWVLMAVLVALVLARVNRSSYPRPVESGSQSPAR